MPPCVWTSRASVRRVVPKAAFFSLVGCAIQACGSLFRVAPFVILEGSPYLSAFKVDQLQAMAMMSIKLNVQAAYI
ncbi:MAG: hypothetical protein WBQ43_07670, partial [Terriglobales bacterium]